MRRKEFEVHDRKRLEEALQAAEVGYLAFHGADGWPRITPVNFVYDGRILWHGALGGERWKELGRDPRATFVAVPRQRYLPSHLWGEENAAAASMAFQSVEVRGQCRSLEDPEEKSAVLNRLMEKYQPEGRYRRMSPGDPLYVKVLSATGAFALTVEKISGKFKLAQNKPREERERIAAWVRRKGGPIDLALAAEMVREEA